ncbi:VPS10 domain-containing protein [Xanthovirga aplysinae]|uniref:VPS10 domain-containing protein n=1 Tax=Xanthovirga aplysinae TaxID=2529853 RepID=UPI0012BC3E8E|nr:glycosyl hydrolase [Xanthovirga aplysinae]
MGLKANRMPGWEDIEQRQELRNTSPFIDYPVRSVGPIVQGARIVDLAVNPSNTKFFYVAYASGGLFKTENKGNSFEPIFDNQGTLTIGDIALAPSDEKIIYVGTGENNSSRSSYAGSGIYKSDDGGQNWKQLGLDNIQHTGRIIVHPKQPNTVWVASLGALYSANPQRGVYKTTDGGKTWDKTLFVNDSTGVIDLVINPENPDQLWAATWERSRQAFDFVGNGEGSAVYRSDDGGENWQKMAAGLPEGKGMGRIGLAISPSETNVLYALVDNQSEEQKEKDKTEKGKLQARDFVDMSVADFQEIDNVALKEFLEENGFPKKYTPESIKKDVSDEKYLPSALADYLGDAVTAMMETTVKGAELYRSDNSGESWYKVNEQSMDGIYYTYGYYFGEVRVSPDNSDELYVLGVPLVKSTDGGKTFKQVGEKVHADQQSMWIDPNDSHHILLGNDGGLYESYDGAASFRHINNMTVGQFYSVAVDMEEPYNIYGGMQDNGTLYGSSKSIPNETENWKEIMGGDGMFVVLDPRDSKVVYTGFQFGNYYRRNFRTGEDKYITPVRELGEPALRYNWRTPVVMSPHNADIIYTASQKLYRSMDQGDNWEAISGDLTKDLPQGNVPFSTITSISESPLKFGLLYVGTDDGNIQRSKDGGNTWELINNGLPEGLWVTKIQASPHEEGTVFVSLSGYTKDDFTTYVYKSTDFGNTWTSLKGNLPAEPVNIVLQDAVNPDLLYVGREHGTYISLNGGSNWNFVYNIPNVASYDMVVHPRENELVIGTHGRSVYVMDVKPLQEMKGKENEAVIAFPTESLKFSKRWGVQRFAFIEAKEPKVDFLYYIGQNSQTIKVEIYNQEGALVRDLIADGSKGFHQLSWDVKKASYKGKGSRRKEVGEREYAQKGTYTLKFINGNSVAETTFEII